MAFKAFLLLLVTILFVATRASSSHDLHEELKIKAAYVQSQTPPPLVTKPPPTYAPPPKVIKPPTPAPPLPKPPVVKPPTYAPPPKVIKAPPPAPPLPKPPVKPPTYAPPLPPVKSKKDCIPLCEQRCSLHSRKRTCMRACMTCCDRCKCVPPGTSGNRERCGKCYTDMTTHGNRSKCP
ncbi:PREDICTED: gibberellin-regulated protein 14-like [Fragaria vesca subsp. vesca]|uniref:gibberellin-regulated protein 14-like n=1 Tax=Fragaria vesca subsp. vesca TaxID=101020 RepID=UPI0002C334EB|nr:PREDICTED: gibberellin-regulated protein 14-like [Fragaria vesca subsp. vesca]